MTRPIRVIQWGTGNVGRHSLRAIVERPTFEVVGVHAHDPAKVGRDAAELCGLAEPTGVLATADADQLLAADADCVVYTVQGETRIQESMTDLCRILASGKNVVSTSMVFLLYPPSIDHRMRDALDTACADGGTTLFTSGFDPGWSDDLLPVVLAGANEWVDRITVTEIMDYATYEDPGFTGVFFGFGHPLDYDAPIRQPGAITGGWGGMLQLVANALGEEIDEFREHHDIAPAPETFTTAMGTIEQGSCAAVRFELHGMVRGETRVVAAHCNRLRDDIAPDWPALAGGASGYRIEIDGTPSLTCEITPKGDSGDHNEGGIIGTAMRVVNAIPAVCAAEPGVVSPLDLPVFAGPFRTVTL
jgi:2,4-diaminopentanoate dehydrogenase